MLMKWWSVSWSVSWSRHCRLAARLEKQNFSPKRRKNSLQCPNSWSLNLIIVADWHLWCTFSLAIWFSKVKVGFLCLLSGLQEQISSWSSKKGIKVPVCIYNLGLTMSITIRFYFAYIYIFYHDIASQKKSGLQL